MWLIWGLVVALMVAGSSLVALPRRSPVQLTALPADIYNAPVRAEPLERGLVKSLPVVRMSD